MVELTVYASAGDFDIARYLSLTDAVSIETRHGRNVFLTNTDARGATAFATRDLDGNWSGDLFLGSATIDSNGKLGFAPEAMLNGDVHGMSGDRYAAILAERKLTPLSIEHKLLAGDDVLYGNIGDDRLSGLQGNDVLIGSYGDDNLDGGSGDDLLICGDSLNSKINGKDVNNAVGGDGNDVIVVGRNTTGFVEGYAGDDLIFLQPAGLYSSKIYGDGSVDHGDDTFHVESHHAGTIFDFDNSQDVIELDPQYFVSLSGGVSNDNIVYGKHALDGDDFLLIYISGNSALLMYDPDGSGPSDPVKVVGFEHLTALGAADFAVVHRDMPTGAPHAITLHLESSINAHVPTQDLGAHVMLA